MTRCLLAVGLGAILLADATIGSCPGCDAREWTTLRLSVRDCSCDGETVSIVVDGGDRTSIVIDCRQPVGLPLQIEAGPHHVEIVSQDDATLFDGSVEVSDGSVQPLDISCPPR